MAEPTPLHAVSEHAEFSIRELCRQFEAAGVAPVAARHRTEWLLVAVGELVDLLPAPSRLAAGRDA